MLKCKMNVKILKSLILFCNKLSLSILGAVFSYTKSNFEFPEQIETSELNCNPLKLKYLVSQVVHF